MFPESYGKFPLAIYFTLGRGKVFKAKSLSYFLCNLNWDLVKIIVTVLQTIKRKVTSDVSGTQTLKDSNFKGFQH